MYSQKTSLCRNYSFTNELTYEAHFTTSSNYDYTLPFYLPPAKVLFSASRQESACLIVTMTLGTLFCLFEHDRSALGVTSRD